MAKQVIYSTQDLCNKLQLRPSELIAAWRDNQFTASRFDRIGINAWVEITDEDSE